MQDAPSLPYMAKVYMTQCVIGHVDLEHHRVASKADASKPEPLQKPLRAATHRGMQ